MLQQPAWDDFRLVKFITETKGLTGAAERLGINHSTAFRRLGQLEERLGIQLFERHRTGYAPTPAGEEMAALADRMEAEVATFTRKLAGQAPTPAGELRVTTNDTLLVHLLTPLFARFAQQYPDIRLDLLVANQALNLSKRDADVAIRATDHPPENLVGRRLASLAWAVYGRAADVTEAGIDLAALTDRPWVSLGDNFAGLKVAQFVRDRVAPERIVYKINTVLGLAEAVEAGIGIGPLPCFIAEARPDLVRLTPPMPEFAAGLWLLTHPDLRYSARVRAFMDFMGAEIGRHRKILECGTGREPPSGGRHG